MALSHPSPAPRARGSVARTSTTTPPTRRFTQDDVTRMVDVGILDPEERIELLEGALVVMAPQSPDHANAIADLAGEMARALDPDAWGLRVQLPLDCGAVSLPEPDLALIPSAVQSRASAQ